MGADGTPVPLYTEVAQLGQEFDRAGALLAGTSPHAEVAILHSYPSRWAVNWQRYNQDFDPIGYLLSFYGRCARWSIPSTSFRPATRLPVTNWSSRPR